MGPQNERAQTMKLDALHLETILTNALNDTLEGSEERDKVEDLILMFQALYDLTAQAIVITNDPDSKTEVTITRI